jgi:uncharacterized protein GlcG (DUF336 family)
MKRIAFLMALAAAPAFAQVANEPTISADAALDVVAGALKHCRAGGQKVSVTVVDVAGRVKAAVRDDGAAPHTAEHSMRKAYTALSYKTPSAEYGKRAQEAKGIAIGPQLLPNITTAAGGVPIRSGGAVIGAVGVSGTPGSAGGGEHDAKCAEAGLARVFPAVAQDKVEAAKWRTVAMANGSSVPEWMRASVESAEAKLAPGEIAEGRRRAQEWLAKK